MSDEPTRHTVTVLVVDDEPQMLTVVAFAMESQGFDTVTALDAETAWRLLADGPVDLVVLDIMLPGESGLTMCRRLREQHGPPVLLLTARAEQEDRLVGLEAGADDYVVKPFHPRELALRVSGILRRGGGAGGMDIVTVGDLRIDAASMVVTAGSTELPLSTTEFTLLLYLARHRGRVVGWRELVERVWRTVPMDSDRELVRSAIHRLRARLPQSGGRSRYIATVRGVGYIIPR